MGCWDIKAKALNVPLYKLLGGKCREGLRAYASQIQFGWGKGMVFDRGYKTEDLVEMCIRDRNNVSGNISDVRYTPGTRTRAIETILWIKEYPDRPQAQE